ncbi:hypothetical protein AB6A68_10760, partial [Ferrimicrobium acidiphilum]
MFDVDETLVDESREYGSWANWLGVPRHTFSATFGAVTPLSAIPLSQGHHVPNLVYAKSRSGQSFRWRAPHGSDCYRGIDLDVS